MAANSIESKYRVYRKLNGDLCLDGPEAAFLAYPVGALIPLQKVDEYYDLVRAYEASEEEKRMPRPADKRRKTRPADK